MGIFPIDEILFAAEEVWEETIEAASESCQQAITEERYEWTNPTVRSKGETVYSPRDIIDTKDLHNSHKIDGEDLVWTADYADINHDGGMVGRRYHRARPWTNHGIKGDLSDGAEWQRGDAILNLPEFFEEQMNSRLNDV
jgi:hypothetical protein